MSRAALTIPFTSDARPSGESVLLEQEELGARSGRLSAASMARYVEHAVYGVSASAPAGLIDCGVDGAGNLDTAVLVWPLRDGVRYRLVATVGSLGQGELGEVENEETVSFTLTETARLQRPGRRILSAQWLTGPWTIGGERIDPPPLAIDGLELRANRPVYGSARVVVLARRYRHPLTIAWDEARPLLEAGDWSEYAVCLPTDAAPVALPLEAPRGAAEMARSGRPCGGVSFHVESDEDGWPPSCPPEGKHVDCDYCSLRCDDEPQLLGEGETP